MTREEKEKIISEKMKKILDPIIDDVKNYLVPKKWISRKCEVDVETVDRYLEKLYNIKIDWRKVERNTPYRAKKSDTGFFLQSKQNKLPIINKEKFNKNYKLDNYIGECLKNHGNTVISDSIYKRLGATGIIYNILRQFKIRTILEITSNQNVIVRLKQNS